MEELYENEDEDMPFEPKLKMALGDKNISKIQHSTYVKSLCTRKNMQEMKSVMGCNTTTCRQFVCPNHEKALPKNSESRSSKSESTTMHSTSSTQLTQWCPVELKLTFTLIPNNKYIKKWHVANVCWEHAEFCEYGKGIKDPSTKVINQILRLNKEAKDAKSEEETLKIFKNLGIDTKDKHIRKRIIAALKMPRSQKSSTTSSTTSSSLVRDKQVFLFNYYYSYVMQKNM